MTMRERKVKRLQDHIFGEWIAHAIFTPPGQPGHSRTNYGKPFAELSFRAQVAAMRHFGSEAAAREAVDAAAAKVAAGATDPRVA